MPRSKRDVEASLKRKGFKTAKGDHNFFLYFTKAGKKSRISTMTSHGRNRDLDDYLLGKMAKQCKISKEEFLQLVDCNLNQDEYEQLIQGAL